MCAIDGGVRATTESGRALMARTKVSSKYQVVIPKDIRARTEIRPGQEFQVIAKGGIITLVPEKPISAMRGFVRGIKTTGFREKKDRL